MTVYKWSKYRRQSNYTTKIINEKKEDEWIETKHIEASGAARYDLTDDGFMLHNRHEISTRGGENHEGIIYSSNDYLSVGREGYGYNSGPYREIWAAKCEVYTIYKKRMYLEEKRIDEFSHYSKGSYISTVSSTSRNAYPDNSYSGSYWYVYEGIDNQAPSISGSNLDLGSKQEDFEIEYTVSDADNNLCTVDIVVDTVKKISSKSVVLNTKYTYPVKIDDFSLGRHTITITAKDSNGATSSRKYTFTKSNTAPVISGSDTDLGEKSTAFTEEYRVTDKNNDNVDITVTLDDLEISNISSAQNKNLSFTISNEQLEKFEIGSSHTITIKADDGKGGVAYRRYTFIKANRPPIISNTDKDLGQKKENFSIDYSLSDVEKDKIYTRIYLDNKQVFENLEVEDGKSYKYTIEKDVFLSLNYGNHEIRIEAWDDNSVDNKQVRIYTFERVSNGLEVEIKINEFDVKPGKVIAVPHGIFASDAVITVKACNNYNDTKPTWEDMSTESKAARAYAFKNSTKTADKWAIGIKIIAENGESDVSSVLRGVKGGYE